MTFNEGGLDTEIKTDFTKMEWLVATEDDQKQIESDFRKVDVFTEITKQNSFIAHGVSGNIDRGRVIKSAQEVWKSIFMQGKVTDPSSRKDSWSDLERYRYTVDMPGDSVRIYGYVANLDIGIGGKSYLGDGIILAPTRGKWMQDVVVNPDLDGDSRSVTPIAMAKYGSNGEYQSIEIPLVDCIIVMNPNMLLDQVDEIGQFCVNNGVNPTEWARTHIIVEDLNDLEEDAILIEASKRCKQAGELLVAGNEKTDKATGVASQTTSNIVLGSKEVKLSNANITFLESEHVGVPKLIEKITSECIRLADAGYFSREKSDYFRYDKEIKRIVKLMNLFGISEDGISNNPNIKRYLEDVKLAIYNPDTGFLDENKTMTAYYPDAEVGARIKFNGIWYDKDGDSWEREKIPSYDDF